MWGPPSASLPALVVGLLRTHTVEHMYTVDNTKFECRYTNSVSQDTKTKVSVFGSCRHALSMVDPKLLAR